MSLLKRKLHVGLRRHRLSLSFHPVSNDHNIMRSMSLALTWNRLVRGFPCITLGETLSSFHSEIGKDEEKIHLSIFSPPSHLSQWHLRYAYLKQQMHRAHGTSSERLCEGIPAAGEPLPPFLLHPFEPPNP